MRIFKFSAICVSLGMAVAFLTAGPAQARPAHPGGGYNYQWKAKSFHRGNGGYPNSHCWAWLRTPFIDTHGNAQATMFLTCDRIPAGGGTSSPQADILFTFGRSGVTSKKTEGGPKDSRWVKRNGRWEYKVVHQFNNPNGYQDWHARLGLHAQYPYENGPWEFTMNAESTF